MTPATANDHYAICGRERLSSRAEVNRKQVLRTQVAAWQEARALRTYADDEHDVLLVDGRKLIERYQQAITLSAINTGAIQPAYAKRGRGTFVPIADYPAKTSGAPAKPVAEITVSEPIIDIGDLTVRVERWRGPERVGVVWERSLARG
jgi:hypothetical protein